MSRKIVAVLVAPVLVAGVALGASLVGGEPAAPPRDVLVVQANLQDAIRPADARDTRDLDNFVDRLAERVPAAPDALLLAEVLDRGAHRLAHRLSAEFDQRYRVVVAPGRDAFSADGSVRETAIVVNTGTLNVERGASGFERIQSEDQAYATVRQAGSDRRLRLVAGHVGGDPAVAAEEFHRLGTDGDAIPVLGVDLRLSRCVLAYDEAPVDCDPQAFWTAMTDTHAYSDAAYELALAQGLRHSGYVFTPGAVAAAGVDDGLVAGEECKDAYDAGRSRTTRGECRADYYADSPFTWARVGAPEPVRRVVLPREVSLGHCEFGTRVGAVVVRVANRTDSAVTDQVTATAAAPIAVDPAEAALTAPPGEARRAVVRVTAPQETPPGRHQVTVRVGPTSTVVPVVIPDGPCVEPAVYASSFNPGRPPEDAIDGDINTFWHSEWSPPHPLPQSITLNLGSPTTVSELRYQPRFDGNLNGTIREYVIYVSVDGRSFTEVTSGTWPVDAREKTATWTATDARYVRLEAHSASGGSYASAAEVTVS
ncbi:discoidin domain-containing protein [Actinophytocola gossypii]|uniref:Discoidin domain-containing protein n=1 Tax=Actinophytocola gossypii TaxID=2812003 RepID=A0ABT2J548_9PSEU|nr:discoidin domain-containing protein [Actinophytocola gossypii]MCT2582989.1 discoidin domain-containing protein [Actinophytocola gossypii]